MAKINGFELKNITNFRGHEGEDLIQANVYYKGKKVGFWSQDSWGGCDNFNLDYELNSELKEEVNNKLHTYKGGIIFDKVDKLYDKTYNITFEHKIKQIGYEYLFSDLVQLIDFEKYYKKYTKQFNTDTIIIFYKDLFNLSVMSGALKGRLKETDTYFIYNSLNDFDINN
jgi:hypothetical protein